MKKTLMLIAMAISLGFIGKGLITDTLAKNFAKKSPKRVKTPVKGNPLHKPSHKQEQGDSVVKKKPQQNQQQKQSAGPRPRFKISYKLNGFGGSHEKKMREALGQLSWVIKSEAFKEKVLAHEYKGSPGYYQSKGMTNQEIYEAILKGAETLNPIEDGKMDLSLTLYHSETNTVGYTYPNTNEIWVNKKYFERYTLKEVANNAMHEWLHKIGFEHSYYSNADRPYTVPYAIGEIVEEILGEMD